MWYVICVLLGLVVGAGAMYFEHAPVVAAKVAAVAKLDALEFRILTDHTMVSHEIVQAVKAIRGKL